MQPYEKQDHVNARFVEETALKHTMTLLGLKYSWNNMLLKKAVKLWCLCKSIYLNEMLFPKSPAVLGSHQYWHELLKQCLVQQTEVEITDFYINPREMHLT